FKRGFDKAFDFIARMYEWVIHLLVRPAVIGVSLAAFAALGLLVFWSVSRVPTGFVPDEDKGLIIAEIWMPDSASQERTLEVIKKVEQIFLSTDGVNHTGGFQG